MKLVMAELVCLLQRILLETNFLWWVCPLLWKSDFLFSTIRKRSLGKVIFLHLCVILFTGGGAFWLPSMHHGSHDQRGVCIRGRGFCIQWVSGLLSGRGSASRGSACRQGLPCEGGLHLGVLHPGRIGSASGGLGRYSPPPEHYGIRSTSRRYATYCPAGMHSCLCDLITYDINSTLTLIWSYHPSSIGSFRASRNISPVESMTLPLQQKDATRKERKIKQ